ncbi:MAG: hypothetical protein OXG68_02405 [Chloroflexi bacterium]|nr:hypothetical protein [Chloroflexota bacterium]
MGEWEDITIIGRDKQQSEQPCSEDRELSRQVFTLSDTPQRPWVEICNGVLSDEPGRVGRKGEVRGQSLIVWGGPSIFAERDANHLKDLVGYVNWKYRDTLAPNDFSGLDAFGS